MFLTEEAALRKSLAMWKWIRDRNVDNKSIYFKDNNIKQTPLFYCYLCEYADCTYSFNPYHLMVLNCNFCCFKKFRKDKKSYFCTEKESPYYKWFYFVFNEKERFKYAQEMVDFLQQCIEIE
jgi:hypothetical protein